MSATDQRAPERVAPHSYLAYEGYRWLKLSVLALALALAAYAFDRPAGGPNGGSWLGYTLGTIATACILWLLWFGVRKRRYTTRGAPLRGWLSGHVYLGIALLVIVPLHSGFQFAWNVHTLAFGLMAATIATGMIGILFYDRVPARITRNRPGQELRALYEQIADLDAECRQQAVALPDEFARAVKTSIEETEISGSLLAQLSHRTAQCGTTRALAEVEERARLGGLSADSRDQVRALIEALSLKRRLLARVRRDVQYMALLDVWLVVHVPLAFGSVAALAIHIFVVFYYR